MGLTVTKIGMDHVGGARRCVGSLKQNDRVIVEISGQMPNNLYHQMGVIDLLPAGLEIEQPLAGDDAKVYSFLGGADHHLTDASRQDARDDRFIAAFDIGERYPPGASVKALSRRPAFHVAYIARAVSVGKFALPAVSAWKTCMRPAIKARTAMGQLNIGNHESDTRPRWIVVCFHGVWASCAPWYHRRPRQSAGHDARAALCRRKSPPATARLLRAFMSKDGAWRIRHHAGSGQRRAIWRC